MIFISNKYTIWYNSIINNAKTRTITGYTEKHHIIPKSLGGSNEKTNVVKLTAREHFVCHLLLTKMTTGNDRYKMIFALHMLSNVKNIGEGRYTASSKLYEYAKKSFKEADAIKGCNSAMFLMASGIWLLLSVSSAFLNCFFR